MHCWHITTSPFLDGEFNLPIWQRFLAHVLEHTLFTTVVSYKSKRMGGRIRRPTVFWSPLEFLSLSTAVSPQYLESESHDDVLLPARRCRRSAVTLSVLRSHQNRYAASYGTFRCTNKVRSWLGWMFYDCAVAILVTNPNVVSWS